MERPRHCTPVLSTEFHKSFELSYLSVSYLIMIGHTHTSGLRHFLISKIIIPDAGCHFVMNELENQVNFILQTAQETLGGFKLEGAVMGGVLLEV